MKLKFGIINGTNRPVIRYNKLRFLFDTGAYVPVWCTGENAFCKSFPEATKQNFKCFLGGFGRTEQEILALKHTSNIKRKELLSSVYSIPSFYLNNDTCAIRWVNLHVVVTMKESIGADLILPSTMFREMGLYWSQENKRKPYIEISSNITTKYMLALKYFNEDFDQELLGSVYAQDSMEFEATESQLPIP